MAQHSGAGHDDIAAARAYVQQHELRWVQGTLGDWSKTSIPSNYGVRGVPVIFLIGPDGKLIAKELRGSAIAPALTSSLSAGR